MSLRLRKFGVRHGAVVAVDNLDLAVEPGEVVAVIGPNGAGKTSLIEGVAGMCRNTGSVTLAGQELTSRTSFDRSRAGLGLVPGGFGVFGDLSVRDNVAVACRSAFPPMWKRLTQWFPVLAEKANAKASMLSGGQRQVVSIARAVATGPKIILMDEPSIGLSPIAVGQLRRLIATLRENGIGVLLSEQNAGLAMSVSDHCHLLVRGAIRLSGTPAELRNRPEVEALYLGRTI